MEAIKNYVTSAGGAAVLCAAAAMLAPAGYEKYLRLALSLIMTAVLLSPFHASFSLPEYEAPDTDAIEREAQGAAIVEHRRNLEDMLYEKFAVRAVVDTDDGGAVTSVTIERDDGAAIDYIMREWGVERGRITVEGGI